MLKDVNSLKKTGNSVDKRTNQTKMEEKLSMDTVHIIVIYVVMGKKR